MLDALVADTRWMFLVPLIAAACGGGTATSTTSQGESGSDPSTSSDTSATIDPDSSTSIDPSTSTTVDPSESTSIDPDSSSSSSSDTSSSTGSGPGCGNGALDDGEDCDGDFLDGEDCMSENFDAGRLTCNDDCTFDYSQCTTVCGDDEIHGLEQCELDDLAGQDCLTQGFDEGVLACVDCMFDLSGCFEFACGNDLVQGDEVCDGADLLGQDCDSQGFGAGVLACAADCAAFDTSSCTPAQCGDDTREGSELCDGDDLAGETCATQGFGPGELTCLGDCTGFDTSQCSEPVDPVCNGGATLLAQNPASNQAVCDDPNNVTCEQDAEQLCPTGWGLCTREQHNNRNEGFDYAVGGGMPPVVVGEIHCRAGGGGAGHLTFGPYDNITNLDQDMVLHNCGYGSSRDACPTGFGCNELSVQALCCAPDPLCGNGVVDAPEETCDDANADEGDECLNSCSWRVPADHPLAGSC